MKRLLKKIGRFFIVIRQVYEHQVRQEVLVMDSGQVSSVDLAQILRNVKERFKNGKVVVWVQRDREDLLMRAFSDLEIIIVKQGLLWKYAQLFSFFKRRFGFVVLSALDPSTIFMTLVFAHCPVFLHNRWSEWYRLRVKTLRDVLQGTQGIDKRRRYGSGVQEWLRAAGRAVVLLTECAEQDVHIPVLFVDNGYTDIGHVSTGVRRTAEVIINPDITILTFAARKHYFENMFPHMKLVVLPDSDERFALARRMWRLRKNRFQRVVLTTLDISPIAVSFMRLRARTLLYNKWHQWWVLEPRDLWGYARKACGVFIIVPVFIYLLIAGIYILTRTLARVAVLTLRGLKPHPLGYG